MGLIKRNISFKNKDEVLSLYMIRHTSFGVYRAVLVSPPCERHCQIRECSAQINQYDSLIMKQSLQGKTSHPYLFSLKNRRLQGIIIECFQIFYGCTNVDLAKLFVMDNSTPTRNNVAKLICRKVHPDCIKFFFTNAVVRDWNKLPPSVM